MRTLIQLALALYLAMGPITAWAQSEPKDPLSYPLKTYGFMLVMAIFGGFAAGAAATGSSHAMWIGVGGAAGAVTLAR